MKLSEIKKIIYEELMNYSTHLGGFHTKFKKRNDQRAEPLGEPNEVQIADREREIERQEISPIQKVAVSKAFTKSAT